MNKTVLIDHNFISLSWQDKISSLYNSAKMLGLPIAIWSLPEEKEFHLIISLSNTLSPEKPEIEKAAPGFLFSPFYNDNGNLVYQLNADVYFSIKVNELVISKTLDTAKQNNLELLLDKMKGYKANHPKPEEGKITFKESGNYLKLVEKGITDINKGIYDKLVLSRNKKVMLDSDFDPIEKLQLLRNTYENAFCYLLYTEDFGNWMAATPETLISLTDEVFETVALAGTANLASDEKLSDVSWTHKEIEEQAMVSRYIINSFKKIRLREFDETGPKTVKAGKMAHLKTTFKVKYKEINFPELASVMLDLLHPTSAVCGMPLEGARDFIEKNEGFNRSLFAGFLGPVNINNSTHFFVNLRTMRFNHKEAVLYAGAGITQDSDPEKEFQETETKMNTMLNILFQP